MFQIIEIRIYTKPRVVQFFIQAIFNSIGKTFFCGVFFDIFMLGQKIRLNIH